LGSLAGFGGLPHRCGKVNSFVVADTEVEIVVRLLSLGIIRRIIDWLKLGGVVLDFAFFLLYATNNADCINLLNVTEE
jgi:hypothetical protein